MNKNDTLAILKKTTTSGDCLIGEEFGWRSEEEETWRVFLNSPANTPPNEVQSSTVRVSSLFFPQGMGANYLLERLGGEKSG